MNENISRNEIVVYNIILKLQAWKLLHPIVFSIAVLNCEKKFSGKRQIKIDKVQKIEDESMIYYEISLYVLHL